MRHARINLNADLGESFGAWSMGRDGEMLQLVASANIACGGHASDPETMFQTLTEACKRGVVIGAHPGYADPLGFGRRVIPMSPAEIASLAKQSVATFSGLSINLVGSDKVLTATATGLTSATTSAFAITPGAATQLAVSVEVKGGVPEAVGPRQPYLFKGWLVQRAI